MRQALTPEEVSAVTRIEDEDGELKLVVLRDRLELSGVPCTPAFLKCFGLFYSVLSGRLPAIDLVLLRRGHPGFLWMSWPDLLAEIGSILQNASKEDFLLLVAEVRGAPEISFTL